MTNNTTYHSFRHSINTVHISVVFSFVFSSLIIFSSHVQYSVFYTLSLCIFSIVLSYRFQHLPYISLLSPVLSHCLLHSVSYNKCLQSAHLFLSINTSVSIFCILVLYLLYSGSVSSIFWFCINYVLVLYSIFWFSIFSVSLNVSS